MEHKRNPAHGKSESDKRQMETKQKNTERERVREKHFALNSVFVAIVSGALLALSYQLIDFLLDILYCRRFVLQTTKCTIHAKQING